MHTISHRTFLRCFHLLIIASLLLQPLLVPLDALAKAGFATNSLQRNSSEDIDAYLNRVATANPDLFQQAALAAVQDVFNGKLPEIAGEKAMEEQVAFYIEKMLNESEGSTAASPTGTNSQIDGDTYRWNSAQQDASGLAGSNWQMIARPGVDPKLFAEEFEKLVNQEPMPAGPLSPELLAMDGGLPEQTALPRLDPEHLPQAKQSYGMPIDEGSAGSPDNALALAPIDSQAVLAAQQNVADLLQQSGQTVASSFEQARQHYLLQASKWQSALSRPSEQTSLPAEQLNSVQSTIAAMPLVQSSLEADLAVTMSAPISVSFGTIITYSFVVTNFGPNPANHVILTHTLPANGVYTPTVAGCTLSNNQVGCQLGLLTVNQSKTQTVTVQMKGNGLVTSTVEVADLGGTLDPGGKAATASASTTVTSTTRVTRVVGKVLIAANEFVTHTGEIRASGAVEIGYKKDNITPTFHLKLGANDVITFTDGGAFIGGFGNVYQIVKNFELFRGGFSIDATKDDPFLIPSPEISATIKKLGGFQLVGKGTITQVTIITGTASVSTTIKLSQPGVTSDTEQALVALIKPGGIAEGLIPKFAAQFAGLKIEVDKATFAGDVIKVKEAKLTMPDQFGKLTGVLSEMNITSNTIDFGGVGVKIPIPDIFPVGSPVTKTVDVTPTAGISDTSDLTKTVTVTPTVAIVKNWATVGVNKGKLYLAVEGTLQLWLPKNERNIPIEVKLDENGRIQGTVKEISLSSGGQDLNMKNVEISNDGLKVEEATLTFKGEEQKDKAANDKKKEKEENPATEPITTSAEIKATVPITETEGKKPDKPEINKLTIIVKKVVIDKNGISIGGAGISNYLPEFKIGEIATFTKMEFTVIINNPTGDASLELAIKGKLKIKLGDNDITTEFSAKRDEKGKFSGKLKEITLTIAKASLKLTDVAFDSSKFSAQGATLTLPPALGSTTASITNVVIDEKGLSFGDASVKIPVEFMIGKAEDANNFAVKGTLGLVLAKDRNYGFVVDATVTIKVASQTAEAAGQFRIDQDGDTRGTIKSFKLVIAGIELSIKDANVEDGVLKASEATFSVPQAWGGLSASVYHVKIDKGDVSIGGGAFKLPEIKVGDMELSLEGKLQKENGGYIIAAGGKLKMPNVGGGGCSGLGVAVEIFAQSSQVTVMRIEPLTAAKAEALSVELRKVSLSLECTVPIGTSGFDLTKVEGTLTLNNKSTKVEIKMTIESQLKVGPLKALVGDGDMTIEHVKNPYKFEIGIGASMKLFSLFEAARARAIMRFSDGAVPFLFKAEMNIDAVIAKGEAKLAAWTKDGSFYLTGRIYGQVGVREGKLYRGCWTIQLPAVRWVSKWWGGYPEPYLYDKEICLTIPPADLFISALMEFGKFKQGNGDTWGFKAAVEILGRNFGIYVDSSGEFSVTNVDQYKLIDAPSLLRALYLHQAVANNLLAAETMSVEDRDLFNSYHFAETGEISIDVTTLTKPGDLGVTIIRSTQDADVTVTLIRPDGLGITGSNPPSHVTFREQLLSYPDFNDPQTGELIQTEPVIQTVMNVTNAELGAWRILLSRQPTYEFVINVDGNVYGPPVEKMSITDQNDTNNLVKANWTQSPALTTTVAIYATQDSITTTASYSETRQVTDANGVTASQVMTVELGEVTQFNGIPVAEFSYPPGQRSQIEQIDLAFLRSGSYHLWIEVNDGENPPARRYFPGTVTVWQPWQESWEANLHMTPQIGALTLEWDEHENPDVDGYEIEIAAGDANDEDISLIDVGQRLSETVTGLSANQSYSVTIYGYDTGTGRTSASESIAATPLSAPFAFASGASALTVNGGGMATALLKVSSPIQPYPDPVFMDVEALPDGFEVQLNSEVVTPTVAGVQSKLSITPSATLPGGVYTITVTASSNGDEKRVAIPVTVREPKFTLQATPSQFTLYEGSSARIDLSATYQNGEQDAIDVYVEQVHEGVDWSLEPASFLPGGKATLLLTATDYLDAGSYPIVIGGSNLEHDETITLTMTVGDFDLFSEIDSRAIMMEGQANFVVDVEGTNWSAPVTIAVNYDSLAGFFSAQLSATSSAAPDAVTASFTARPGTPPGIYELLIDGSSRGITHTLPLYITVQEDANLTDLQLHYEPTEADAYVIAGEIYSYTVIARNISSNPAEDVVFYDSTTNEEFLSLVDDGGCGVQIDTELTELECTVGNVASNSDSSETTIAWEVDPDAEDGALIVHDGEVVVQGTAYSETSLLDNVAALEVEVYRFSDLVIEAETDDAEAGMPFTYTATVTNYGPSYADDATIELFLPAGVALQTASAACELEGDLLRCTVGELALNQSASITATVEIEAQQRGDLQTLLVANSASEDPDYENNAGVLVNEVEANAALTLKITPDRTSAKEGETVNYRVAVNNQGPAQATDVALDLAASDTLDIVDLTIDGVEQSLDHLDIAPGETLTMNVTIQLLDDSNGQPVELEVQADALEAPSAAASNSSLRVNNVNPTAVLSSTLTVNEGELGIFTVHVDDPAAEFDPLTIQWDLDNDGQFDDGNSGIVLFDARAIDGPATRPIAVRVTDDDGGSTITRGNITIQNVAPVVDAGVDQRHRYDELVTIQYSVVDPASKDSHTLQIDWGDGSNKVVASNMDVAEAQVSHTYNRIGKFNVALCVKDDEGKQGCDQVVAEATCRDNGLVTSFARSGNTLFVSLHNATGNVTIPAGYPFTFYSAETPVLTFTLPQAIPVGSSLSLVENLPAAFSNNTTLRLAADDPGTGVKSSMLCSGSVEAAASAYTLYLPVVRR